MLYCFHYGRLPVVLDLYTSVFWQRIHLRRKHKQGLSRWYIYDQIKLRKIIFIIVDYELTTITYYNKCVLSLTQTLMYTSHLACMACTHTHTHTHWNKTLEPLNQIRVLACARMYCNFCLFLYITDTTKLRLQIRPFNLHLRLFC